MDKQTTDVPVSDCRKRHIRTRGCPSIAPIIKWNSSNFSEAYPMHRYHRFAAPTGLA
jgi:hypothetical protein